MSNRGYRGGGNQASSAICSRLRPCRAAALTCITYKPLWSLQGGGWGGNRGGGGGGGRGGENIACSQRLLPAAGPLGKQLHLPSLAPHTAGYQGGGYQGNQNRGGGFQGGGGRGGGGGYQSQQQGGRGGRGGGGNKCAWLL